MGSGYLYYWIYYVLEFLLMLLLHMFTEIYINGEDFKMVFIYSNILFSEIEKDFVHVDKALTPPLPCRQLWLFQ